MCDRPRDQFVEIVGGAPLAEDRGVLFGNLAAHLAFDGTGHECCPAGSFAGGHGLVLGLALRQGASWPLSEPHRRHLSSRYVLPRPRTLAADAVRSHATASIDLSDGLARDLATVCRTSEVGADIDLRRLPLSPAAAAVVVPDPTALATVVAGGDDYEILCTVPADRVDGFRTAARAVGVPVTDIGVIIKGSRPAYTGTDGRPFAAPAGFSHF